MTDFVTHEQARELVDNVAHWSKPLELPNGYAVRAKLEYDEHNRLEDNGDWFGSLHWPARHSRERPAGCNGAARKITTRSGPIWWQPPTDLVSDPENLAKLETRVRDYFLEQWSFVGVVVEVQAPACECCGERKSYTQSLWGIESDAGEYFTEVLNELVGEAIHEAETKKHG